MLEFHESMINLCESNRHLKGSVHHSSLLQNSTTQFGSGVHTNLMLQRLPLPNHKAVQLQGKLRKKINFPAAPTTLILLLQWHLELPLMSKNYQENLPQAEQLGGGHPTAVSQSFKNPRTTSDQHQGISKDTHSTSSPPPPPPFFFRIKTISQASTLTVSWTTHS